MIGTDFPTDLYHPVTGQRQLRVTREDPYSNPNCMGHRDLRVRQGNYVFAPEHLPLVDAAKYAAAKLIMETGDRAVFVEMGGGKGIRYTCTGKVTVVSCPPEG